MKTIVVLMDTLNRRMLGAYNNTWVRTPNIDRLAAKSVVFDNHWSGSLPCMPARRDLLTGRMAFLEKGWGAIEPFDVTLPKELKKNGVFSHIVTDHYHYFATGGENYCQQFDTWDFHRGQESDPWVSRVDAPALPDSYYGQVRAQYELNRTRYKEESDYSGPRTMSAACDWLRANKDADEFMLMIEAFDPHEPFDCPKHYLEKYDDRYDGPRFDWPRYARAEEPPEALDHITKRYAATLSMIDHWFGKLLDVMDAHALWDDTLLIFTTDHGFMLGEHGYMGKNYMHVYNELAHIPLMIHLPGGKHGGKRVAALTQNIDIMPTILDYCNAPVPSGVQGHSLKGLLEGTAEKVRDYALYGYHGMGVNLTDGRYTFLKAPAAEDNHPCFFYTAVPTTFRSYIGGQASQMDMGRFLKHTEYPVYKIPRSQQGTVDARAAHIRETQLFDIENDYLQQSQVQDPALIQHYEKALVVMMGAFNAPEEQFYRLGFK